MNSTKLARTEKWIRLEVSQLFQTKLDSALLKAITITDVRVAKDLSYATIYWACYNKHAENKIKEISDELQKVVGACRKHLAQISSTYTVPKLRFKYDDSIEKAARIENIINKIKTKND